MTLKTFHFAGVASMSILLTIERLLAPFSPGLLAIESSVFFFSGHQCGTLTLY